MKNLLKFIAVLLFTLTCTTVYSQKSYALGEKVNDFTLLNINGNTQFQLSQHSNKQVVVLIFTANDCPYAKLYEDRIITLNEQYKDKGVLFVLINPNNPTLSAEDSPSMMEQKIKEKKYSFPYLTDPAQVVASRFGATKTPEAFVLKNINGSFYVKYKGAIDDNPQIASDVHQQYLQDAIVALLQKDTIKITEIRASGCLIKK